MNTMKQGQNAHLHPARASGEEAGRTDAPVTVIEPETRWGLLDLRELWRYRELLFFLTWRDVKVRYKQTVLGVGWALTQPLATMLVFVVFLGRMGGISTGVEHYALYVLAGMIPWTFFSNAIGSAGNSLVANERLVTKVYFPRVAVPLSCVGAALFDLGIAFLLLLGLAVCYGVVPGLGLFVLPLVLLLLVLVASGVGLFLSALIVAQRDFRYVMYFAIQMWMFATPSIYLPPGAIGPRSELLLPLNPAHGLILNFRLAVMNEPINWYALGVSGTVCLGLFVIGAFYFRMVERSFADLI